MSHKSKIQVIEQVEYLKKLLSKSTNLKQKQKIKGLLILKSHPDFRQETVAYKTGISLRTLSRWLKIYNEEGLDELLKTPVKGRPKSVIPDAVRMGLEQKVKDSSKPLKGYFEAVIWIEEEFGIKIKYNTVRNYLISNFNTKLKTPRKSHYKKDNELFESFKKNTKSASGIIFNRS